MHRIKFIDDKPNFAVKHEVLRPIIEAAGMEYIPLNCSSEDDVIRQCQDADIVMNIDTPITRRIIQSLPRCKAYIRFGIGYDVVDVDACTENGIYVCNSPDHCIDEVATHTVALILAATRKVVMYNDEVRKGRFLAHEGYAMHRLSSQTIGFVGFGSIARKTASYLSAFGARLIAFDPFLSEEEIAWGNAEKVSKDELLASSDIITLHVPLFKSTFHIINKDSFQKMKDGVILVNTSRGALVCEEDLIDALDSGKVRAAALDVVENEPITEPNHRLFDAGHVIITPHVAFSSTEANVDMLEKIARTAVSILKGQLTSEVVNRIVNRCELQIKPIC